MCISFKQYSVFLYIHVYKSHSRTQYTTCAFIYSKIFEKFLQDRNLLALVFKIFFIYSKVQLKLNKIKTAVEIRIILQKTVKLCEFLCSSQKLAIFKYFLYFMWVRFLMPLSSSHAACQTRIHTYIHTYVQHNTRIYNILKMLSIQILFCCISLYMCVWN